MKKKSFQSLLISLTLLSVTISAQPHPGLMVKGQDLPTLKNKAVSSNPYFNALKQKAITAKTEMDTYMPAGDAGINAYTAYPCEMYSQLFAFMSMITTGADSIDYATRARTLLMHVMNIAQLGAQPSTPFRDPGFMTGDRSRWWGHGFPLTVDWIYPHLSAADKTTIRTVMLRWCKENMNATTTTYNHPTPKNVLVNPSLLVNDSPNDKSRRKVRYSANNYYLAHLRNLLYMSSCMNTADDPGQQLHSYIDSVSGSWLYVTDNFLNNEGKGGLSAEGFLYGPSAFGRLMQAMLSFNSLGEDNTSNPLRGTWSTLSNPFWSDIIPGLLHSMSPQSRTNHDWPWLGTLYFPASYGDIQRFRSEDFIELLGPLGYYDAVNGTNAQRLNAIRYIQTHLVEGGSSQIFNRMEDDPDFQVAIFYFLLFNPNDPAPTDPRLTMPTNYYAEGIGRILARTDWSPNASWFAYKCGFNRVDHQHGDGNAFMFYRKGEYMTSELSGYGYDIAVSPCKNTLALENNNPAGGAGSPLTIAYQNGSQWFLNCETDGTVTAKSFDSKYVYATGDATGLYTYINPWVPVTGNDITHASRSIVWLKPDDIFIYDRATSTTSNRYKQFWLGLPSTPTVTGKNAVSTTPSGQQLFVSSLLPAASSVSAVPYGNYVEPAEYEQMTARLRVEATGGPADVRFLHVLQSKDQFASAQTTTLIPSVEGTYEGANMGNVTVMFKKNITTPFSSFTFEVPLTNQSVLLTGLSFTSGYNVNEQILATTKKYTVTVGTTYTSDAGGTLWIGPPVGINESVKDKVEISVFPNPGKDEYNIRSSSEIILITITDVTGRKVQEHAVKNEKEIKLNTTQLQEGVYLVRIKTEMGEYTTKWLKKN
ncbi:MAG: hypothetical protein K0S32_3908 [Bacteroidetes bacterium]|jgi:hypothetical protein|nr:hypothetical protein [Bacteroidota bacterium]